MSSAAIAAIGLFAATLPQQAAPSCAVTRATIFYERLADMPAEIRADVPRHGEIADAGQPYNEYDYSVGPELPHRRFILGGTSGGNWFVWLRHGGFDRHYHVLGYHPVYSHVNEPPHLRLAADFTGEPCVAINAFLNGVTTSLRDNPGER
jgi:hypothetical protein